jgi:trimethylamine-N-oxide reductase (cytochrome c)
VTALAALAIMFRTAARQRPSLAARLGERDAVIQMRLRGGLTGRWFQLRSGRLRSGAGLHPSPDLTMWFETPEVAARILTPRRDYGEFVGALKSFQLGVDGPDDLAVWFSETLELLLGGELEYGTRLGDDVVRYTSNTNGGPVFVYVKNGRILRITPIELDDDDAPSWAIEARGRLFAPPRRATLSPHSLAWKSMVYSPQRLLHPLKRVDFDPEGERNPQNRGVSGYERISWDEALDLVSSEIKRVKREHGPGAVMNGTGAHHSWGNLGHWLSARQRFFNVIGATTVQMNPDSWEGWYWGAVHHWGHTARAGAGETYSTVEDCLKHCELVVFWSSDPETTGGIYGAFEGTVRRQWLQELGVPFVHIDPYYNHTAGLFGGAWLAPRPGTDSALVLAIAYVWMTEGLYDAEYVATRTVGFERWRSYVLGEDDGVPKTPEWQEVETGVPARQVRALARMWGSRRTYLAAGGLSGLGGACRTATGKDWARGMVCLMAMQGLGKPGVNLGCMQQGTPVDTRFFFPGYAEGGFSGDFVGTALGVTMYQRMPQLPTMNTVTQQVPRLRLPEAVLEGQAEGYACDPRSIEGQFAQFAYPMPGYSRARLYYRYGGSQFGTASETNRLAAMYRSSELECVVNQSIWMEGEAAFADVILPACTSFERWDIGEFANSAGYVPDSFTQCNHRMIVLQHPCIEPLGESRSDYRIFLGLAERLGLGSMYGEGMTELSWCRRLFDATDLPRHISWREFLKKGYYVVPAPPEGRRDPVAYRWYVDGRPKDTPDVSPLPGDYTEQYRCGLQTQSGKLEFESSSLKRFDAQDPERPPILTYVPAWEGPHASELFERYPLQLVSPHVRHSFHTQSDGKDSIANDALGHRVLIDGYYYWILRIHPRDAGRRGIDHHDLIEVFNDRGSVICAAVLTERVRPGVVHAYHGSAVYDPIGEPGCSADRGGCMNLLTPSRMMLKRSHSMAANSCLVELRTWREPEAG